MRISGALDQETTIVRTGGASDGTTPISLEGRHDGQLQLFAAVRMPADRDLERRHRLGRTATVEGIWGGGAVPNDDDVWLDVEYLGDASSPQGSFVNDGKANLLTTAAAASRHRAASSSSRRA